LPAKRQGWRVYPPAINGVTIYRGRETDGSRWPGQALAIRFRPQSRESATEVKSKGFNGVGTADLSLFPYHPGTGRVFRFPPLGVGYLAASLQEAGHAVKLLDCTFLPKDSALLSHRTNAREVVGNLLYGHSAARDCLWFASRLRGKCKLMVAGGPLPTCDPRPLLGTFRCSVRGEGETNDSRAPARL